MKYLIYLGHPAQYHFFKNIVKGLTAKGHEVKLLLKSKDILETLLKEDGFEYENILPEGRKESKSSMFISMLKRDIRVLKIARKFKPDVLLGSDTCVAHVGWLICKPCIAVGEDDYSVVKKLAWLMLPFSTKVLTPNVCDLGPFNYKKYGYEGYMKLSYLHPSVFIPNPNNILRLTQGKQFVIIRLAKLTAHHDKNIKGLSEDIIARILKITEKFNLNVYIDSEINLPQSLLKYQLDIEKSEMHNLMSFAHLLISDSQSMSVEAAMLGIPSIRYNDFVGKISVLEELENKYELTFGISTSNEQLLYNKVNELLSLRELRETFQQRRSKMLSEKINVSEHIIKLLEGELFVNKK